MGIVLLYVSGRRVVEYARGAGGGKFEGTGRIMDWQDYITVDPSICHGKACVKGTRVRARA